MLLLDKLCSSKASSKSSKMSSKVKQVRIYHSGKMLTTSFTTHHTGKMVLLDKLLPKLHKDGHKVPLVVKLVVSKGGGQ